MKYSVMTIDKENGIMNMELDLETLLSVIKRHRTFSQTLEGWENTETGTKILIDEVYPAKTVAHLNPYVNFLKA